MYKYNGIWGKTMNFQVKLIKNDSPAWTKILYHLAILDMAPSVRIPPFLSLKND